MTGIEWVRGHVRRFHRSVHEPPAQLQERTVERVLRPHTGNVRVEPRDSPELQQAQAFVYALALIDDAFKGER